ncbi:expressed protein [Phakopsora pachyrhizi]|uniref:Expressed protein n=1 Tax=Phakopsora pachyrhizi TaxID=170000 RepID=A0AAV0BCU5_PHAPC|nr:expressed protein [Phakopsora pachyrhizi]
MDLSKRMAVDLDIDERHKTSSLVWTDILKPTDSKDPKRNSCKRMRVTSLVSSKAGLGKCLQTGSSAQIPSLNNQLKGTSDEGFRIKSQGLAAVKNLFEPRTPTGDSKNVNSIQRFGKYTSSSESGWDTEEEKNKNYVTESSEDEESLENKMNEASEIIEQIGRTWKSAFDEEIDFIKQSFKIGERQIEDLLLSDSVLAQALSKQLQISTTSDLKFKSKVAEIFGNALEEAVQIQAHLDELQVKLKDTKSELKISTNHLKDSLAQMKVQHAEEIENFKAELDSSTKSLRTKVHAARSSKTEQKDMQRHLASYLEDGLG